MKNKVQKGIILAAGFGSRMIPVTFTTPKPLVKVNGIRIIDTLIDKLLKAGIVDIYIVRGYLKDSFNELLEKYPFIHFIDNEVYNRENNISSVIRIVNLLENAYLCEADLIIKGDDIILPHQEETNYVGTYVEETVDWCFDVEEDIIKNYRKGGERCYQAFGISYWTKKDAKKLKHYLKRMYKKPENKQKFWEMCIFDDYKKHFKIKIREVNKDSIQEIDTFEELVKIDDSYAKLNTQ